jgi:hypothetical protein
MADLNAGQRMSLRTPLSTGMVIALHSAEQDLALCSKGVSAANPKGYLIETKIQLHNMTTAGYIGDIVLEISIRRAENAVLFNAQAKESVLDGWGQPESIPLSMVNPSPSTSGLTILVCDRGDKYQILFNLSTVHYFTKRFPGPATWVTYLDMSYGKVTETLSETLTVNVRKIKALPAHERGPIESGKYVHVLQISGTHSL